MSHEESSGHRAIWGESQAIGTLLHNLRKFAPVELPLLITGETGTGKEVAARTLHQLSPRQDRPFAAINCGALPANLVQSELFGHERGSFTGATSRRIGHFESADGGTVFLDEIGDLPLDAQTNLLRVLQEGTIERIGSCRSIRVDVRVLAATHVDLEKAVAQGRFREDLFYRLNVLRLRMPPLRERGSDVDLNADAPGTDRDSLGGARTLAEREAIVDCLRASAFNISECARRLRVSRVTVYRLCKKHQLVLDELR